MKTELLDGVIFQKQSCSDSYQQRSDWLAGQITATTAVHGFAVLFLFPSDDLIDCFSIPPPLWRCSAACFRALEDLL